MMKKAKQNASEIIFWGVICITVFAMAYMLPYGVYRDYAYQFAAAIQLSKGRALYSEVSTLAMPLSLDIVGIIFKIFGPSYRLYKFLGAIYALAITYAVNEIGFIYGVKTPWRRLMAAFAAALMIMDQFMPGYNELIILFSLLTVIALNKKQWFLTGILCGLAVCAKQNLGAELCVCIGFYMLFHERKNILKIICGAMIPLIIVAIRLYPVRTAAYDLMIAGPSENFGQNAAYFSVGIFGLLAAIALFEMEFIAVWKEHKQAYHELYLFSIVGMGMASPIADDNHIRMLTIGLIMLCCINFDHKYPVSKQTIYALMIIPVLLTTRRMIYFEKLRQMYGTTQAQYLQGETVPLSDYDDVEQYLQNEKVKGTAVHLISGDGEIYSIPCDIYDALWACPLHGNVGANEIEKWKSAIDSYPVGTLMLVSNKHEIWQFPTEIAEYAKQSGTYVGQIGRFSIYRK